MSKTERVLLAAAGLFTAACLIVPTPRPKPVPLPPVPQVVGLPVHVVVRNVAGDYPEHIRGVIGTATWSAPCEPLSFMMLNCPLPPGVDYGVKASVKFEGDGSAALEDELVLAADINVTLPAFRAPARRGPVHLIGKAWADDDGAFYPESTTLLWGLGGWMKGGTERERVKDNLLYIKSLGFDGVRIIYHVRWVAQPYGGTIDGSTEALAELLDWTYNVAGLRVKVTVNGGGASDPIAEAREVVAAVVPRRQTVLLLEGVNEQNFPEDVSVAVTRVLCTAGVPCAVGWGNAGAVKVKELTAQAGATVAILHRERGGGDARENRQPYDFHDFVTASDDGEGPGPGSSVSSQSDPFNLGVQRIGSIAMGAGCGCLHSGSGVYGVDYEGPTGHRYANLKNIPNFEKMAFAVVNASKIVTYVGVENWHATNTGIPIEVVAGHVDKQYYAISPVGDFLGFLTDTSGTLRFRENKPSTYMLIHPLTGQQMTGAEDMTAYIVKGKIH